MNTNVQQGDWMIPYNCEEPHRIKEISYQEELAGRWTVVTFEGKGFFGVWHYPQNCKPVPITKEILESNGFIREGGASYWHEGDRYACILHWSEDKEQLVIGSPCDDCMVKMNVRYVHELQHAFRLAGIDKEIKLED